MGGAPAKKKYMHPPPQLTGWGEGGSPAKKNTGTPLPNQPGGDRVSQPKSTIRIAHSDVGYPKFRMTICKNIRSFGLPMSNDDVPPVSSPARQMARAPGIQQLPCFSNPFVICYRHASRSLFPVGFWFCLLFVNRRSDAGGCKDRLDVVFEFGEIDLDGFEDRFVINAKIMVDDFIPCSGGLPPWDIRVFTTQLRGDIPDCFTNCDKFSLDPGSFQSARSELGSG